MYGKLMNESIANQRFSQMEEEDYDDYLFQYTRHIAA
jgi:hypothetical protein